MLVTAKEPTHYAGLPLLMDMGLNSESMIFLVGVELIHQVLDWLIMMGFHNELRRSACFAEPQVFSVGQDIPFGLRIPCLIGVWEDMLSGFGIAIGGVGPHNAIRASLAQGIHKASKIGRHYLTLLDWGIIAWVQRTPNPEKCLVAPVSVMGLPESAPGARPAAGGTILG